MKDFIKFAENYAHRAVSKRLSNYFKVLNNYGKLQRIRSCKH